MRHFSVLFILAIAALIRIHGQAASGTVGLPSQSFFGRTGIQHVNLRTAISLDRASSSYPNFGNVTFGFLVDTRYVDMQFRAGGGSYRLSDGVNSPSDNYTLSYHGMATLAPETGGIGTAAGFIMRMSGPGTTLFDVRFGAIVGSSLSYFGPMGNLLVCGDGSLIQLLINTDAIAGLPGRSYRFGWDAINSAIRNGAPADNGALSMSGGIFAVPEPASIGALAAAGIALIRRPRRQ